MYEVLKFIEHGAHCRQSMDCVRGTILLSYLRENPGMEKVTLIAWFRELAVCVDQYHRSHSRQNYRYLNPCSIVVSEEGTLFLLDTEAPDNEPVMKRMQSRAVRSHFVKPVYEIGVGKNNEADLFAYGRTIQFILAYAEIHPALSRREEKRLSRVIARCTGESGKRYEDLRQVLRDLPPVPRRQPYASEHGRSTGVKKTVILAGAAVCLAVCVFAGVGGRESARSQEMAPQDELRSYAQQAEQRAEEEEKQEPVMTAGTEVSRVEEAAEKAGLAVKSMAECLEDRKFAEEMIRAYGRVMELETDGEKIREAGLKKMKLEMQIGEYEQALGTAGMITEKSGGSEELSALIGECGTISEETQKTP